MILISRHLICSVAAGWRRYLCKNQLSTVNQFFERGPNLAPPWYSKGSYLVSLDICKCDFDKRAPYLLRGRWMAKVIYAKINCQTAVIKSKLKKMHLCVMPFFDDFHSFEGVICRKFA